MWRRLRNVHVLLHVRACGDCPVSLATTHMRWIHGQGGHESTGYTFCVVPYVGGLPVWLPVWPIDKCSNKDAGKRERKTPTPCECEQAQGQDKTRQDKTRQDKTRQDKTRQDKTRQDKTRQDKTRQDKTRQDKTRQDKTRQDKTSDWSFKNRTGVSSDTVSPPPTDPSIPSSHACVCSQCGRSQAQFGVDATTH